MSNLFEDLPDPDPFQPWDGPPAYRPGGATGTIQQRFEAFHEANPWVLEAMERMTRDMLARGHKRVGVGMMCEVIRWKVMRETTDAHSGFKINDQYSSRYARLMIERHPEWADVFETRRLRELASAGKD